MVYNVCALTWEKVWALLYFSQFWPCGGCYILFVVYWSYLLYKKYQHCASPLANRHQPIRSSTIAI